MRNKSIRSSSILEANQMPDEPFATFMARIREGDNEAAARLVRDYEKAIQREVRIRLNDPAVARVLNEEDVCQSVLASFFLRASNGQFDIERPNQLLQLLLSMARNKIAEAARRLHAQKRGGGAIAAEADSQLASDSAATASRIAMSRETLEQVRAEMTPEERQVADLRGQGFEWSEIAQQLGGTGDGRRMQLTRALDRVVVRLGLELPQE
jgi:RNA polymerase sigma factor (sigma-70 family)